MTDRLEKLMITKAKEEIEKNKVENNSFDQQELIDSLNYLKNRYP